MSLTPWMQQYYDMKKEYEDTVLFFRMGDFYEMFDSDAEIAHKVLGIALTSRNKNAATPTPLAGFPHHAREKYLKTLVDAGYKVAIAEQVSDPKLKWIVKREVQRVVTPATLSLESEAYDTPQSQILVSLIEEDGKYGFSMIDIATHDFSCSEFDSESQLLEKLYSIYPKEIIGEKSFLLEQSFWKKLAGKFDLHLSYFTCQENPEKKLLAHFWVKSLESYGVSQKKMAQKAAALLLSYIESQQKTQISFLQSFRFETFSGFMWLDESTIKSLDLIYNFVTGTSSKGTLFSVMNTMKTISGKRRLRYEILHPLQKQEEIEKRQDFIQAFLEDKILLEKVQKELKSIADMDAILARISLSRMSIRDMILLKKSLIAIRSIYTLLEKSENPIFTQLFR
jgi:DNA mismatch repair protein MutS